MWVLRGTWKNRQGIVSFNSQPVPPTGPLPPYVPALATLYLGKADSWPYRLDLVGRQITELIDTRPRGPDGRPIGARRTIEPADAQQDHPRLLQRQTERHHPRQRVRVPGPDHGQRR